MTTTSWSSRVRHDSDATYQEWRDEFITKLGILVTGGVLAADETNITPAAGARPGTNTEGGYAVYHISDSLHGTAPIYIRFGFGTGSVATAPRIQVTTGTSTNGSGVLGGTALSTIASINNSASQVTDTARTSYFSATAGFIGLAWKVGATTTEAFFTMCRTVDSDGAITATGALACWGFSSSSTYSKRQAFRFAATAAAYTSVAGVDTGTLGFSPQAPSNTTVGSDFQVAVAWTITPRVAPLIGICGVYPAELTSGSTFTTTLVGTTSHTYISVAQSCSGPFGPVTVGAGALQFAMLWE